MVVDTPHGEFEIQDITRKERRKHYKEVKKTDMSNLGDMHELCDKFALLAFGDEKTVDEKLKGLSAVEEDEVLSAIIVAYMGLKLGNSTGD